MTIQLHSGDGGGFTLTGDAIAWHRARTLAIAIKLYTNTGMMPTRGMTITRMLELATSITKKPYSVRGLAPRQQAINDLNEYASLLKSGLPVVDDKGQPV